MSILIDLDAEAIKRAGVILKQADDKVKRSISFAINRASQSYATVTIKQTAKRYFIKQKELRENHIVRRAFGGNVFTGGVSFWGTRKSLTEYAISPKKNPVKPGTFRGAVKRAGGLKPIPLAFLLPGNRPAIREDLSAFGQGQRIVVLTSPSIPQIVQNRQTKEEATIRAQESFERRLIHELKHVGEW